MLPVQVKFPQFVGRFSLNNELALFQFVVIRFTSKLFQVCYQIKKILTVLISVLFADPE